MKGPCGDPKCRDTGRGGDRFAGLCSWTHYSQQRCGSAGTHLCLRCEGGLLLTSVGAAWGPDVCGCSINTLQMGWREGYERRSP